MNNNERPVLSIIQDIKSGTINPKGLDKEIRKQCVETLMFEGYSVPQIAQVLDRSEKTIKRDIAQIHERNALDPSADFAKRRIGDLLLRSESHRTSLMRLSRGRDGSVGEKSQAEYLAWKITEDVTKLLQTMGYLPLKPKEVVGDFVHHTSGLNSEKSFDELKGVLDEVMKVAEETGTITPELKSNVNALNSRLKKAEIEYEAKKLLNESKQENKEDNDERHI